MNKVITFVLMILFSTVVLINISCSETEQSSEQKSEIQTKAANSAPQSNQTRDALSGKPININIYSDYEGKRIYFCCYESLQEFSGNPEKYLKAFRSQGVTLKNSPKVK